MINSPAIRCIYCVGEKIHPVFELQNLKTMKHLTLAQRYEMEILLKQQISNANITDTIGVNKSSISREIRPNYDERNGIYKAELAHSKTEKKHLGKG